MAKLIILEGLDGSGKSTQTALAQTALKQMGLRFRTIKLPDYESPSSSLVQMYLSGAFGKDPQSVNAYAAGAFYAVDRYASYHLDWQADYRQDDVILADRYATSNAIYQMVKLKQSAWDVYLDWSSDFEYKKLGIPVPDAVIFLDVPPDVSQKLMSRRYEGDESKKDVHERNVAYLNACRKAALYTAKKQGWFVVNCTENGQMRPPQAIHEEIMLHIESVL